jgi:hypothetical protein
MSVGTGTAIALGVAAGTAGGSALAAHETAGAAEKGAASTAQAANYAADLTSKSAADSLAFEKQKDQEAAAQFNATQKANYDQYAAREARMNDLRQQLGLPIHDLPPYVPTPYVGATGSSAAPGASPAAGAPSGPTGTGTAPAAALSAPKTTGDPVYDAIAKNYADLGVSPTGPGSGPTDIAYMTQQAKASIAAGERPLSYWIGPTGRIAQELGKAGGATGASGTAPANTLASFLPGGAAASLAPSAPTLMPYMNPSQGPQIYSPTIGSYLAQP